MTFGEKLKALRSSKGLGQKELAKLSGISLAAIRKYEIDDRYPKPEFLIKLSEALGVHTNSLMDDTAIKEKYKTVGDVFYLITLIDDIVGFKIIGEKNASGKYNPETIKIEISDKKINEAIADWAEIRDIYIKDMGAILSKDYSKLDIENLSPNDILDMINYDSSEKYLENLRLIMSQKIDIPLADEYSEEDEY